MDILRIGNTLLATINGEDYRKEFDSSMDAIDAYQDLKVEDSEEFALSMFAPSRTYKELEVEKEYEEQIAKAKEHEDILDFMKDVKTNGHELFEVRNNSVYLKGINISMPELLIRSIAEAEDDDTLNSLIKFWMLCAMNPDPRARFDLFTFLQKGKFSITQSGYFVAYRNANIKNRGNHELQKFITQEYFKIKRWKKSPKNYEVVSLTDGTYKSYTGGNTPLDIDEDLGNLDKLYNNVSDVTNTVYTDAHSGTTTIKIGEPVSIDRKLCDADPNQTCSSGLHVATTEFLGSDNYFGSTGLVCLINPKNVVAVPDEYTMGKMRVCEYFPIAIAEKNDKGQIIEVDTLNFELELVENTQEELDVLTSLSSTQLEEYKKHEYFPIDMDLSTLRMIKQINIGLDEANEIVRNREL